MSKKPPNKPNKPEKDNKTFTQKTEKDLSAGKHHCNQCSLSFGSADVLELHKTLVH